MDLHLEVWEINLILKALGKLPWEEADTTIQNIKEQMHDT